MISKFRVLVVLLMCAATWYVMQSTSEVEPVPIKKTLALFPHVIGEYTLSNAFQSSSEVVELLGVDDYIQYNYIRPDGRRINLYVGYYEVVGMGKGYHSPKNCIPGGGWGIDRVEGRQIQSATDAASASTISEMIIRRGNEYQVVFYWYQNRGRIIASEYSEKIYQILDAIFKSRRDGSFVRIMASVADNDIAATEADLKEFSEIVMTQLKDYLPGTQL
jgi:EpsI family protein